MCLECPPPSLQPQTKHQLHRQLLRARLRCWPNNCMRCIARMCLHQCHTETKTLRKLSHPLRQTLQTRWRTANQDAQKYECKHCGVRRSCAANLLGRGRRSTSPSWRTRDHATSLHADELRRGTCSEFDTTTPVSLCNSSTNPLRAR